VVLDDVGSRFRTPSRPALLQVDDVVGDQAVAARDQVERQLALADAALPRMSTPTPITSMSTPCTEVLAVSASCRNRSMLSMKVLESGWCA